MRVWELDDDDEEQPVRPAPRTVSRRAVAWVATIVTLAWLAWVGVRFDPSSMSYCDRIARLQGVFGEEASGSFSATCARAQSVIERGEADGATPSELGR